MPADELANAGGASEGDLVDIGMADQGTPGLAGAGDDVYNPGGEPGVLKQLGELEGGEWRGLCGFEHDGVATGKRWCNLPGGHEQRKVPGNDLGGDAVWREGLVGKGVFELVSPACVVKEMSTDERQIDIARLANGLATIHGFNDGEFSGAFLEQAGDAKEVFSAFGAAEPGPSGVVCLAGGLDGEVDICFASFGDGGDGFLSSRIGGGEVFA